MMAALILTCTWVKLDLVRKFQRKQFECIKHDTGSKTKIVNSSLLPYKEKNDAKNSSLKLIINYDISYNILNSFIYKIYNKLAKEHLIFSKKIMIINSINNNVGNILINNFKLGHSNPKAGFVKCNDIDCVCKFSLNIHFIKLYNLFR